MRLHRKRKTRGQYRRCKRTRKTGGGKEELRDYFDQLEDIQNDWNFALAHLSPDIKIQRQKRKEINTAYADKKAKVWKMYNRELDEMSRSIPGNTPLHNVMPEFNDDDEPEKHVFSDISLAHNRKRVESHETRPGSVFTVRIVGVATLACIAFALNVANNAGWLEPFKHPMATMRKLFKKQPALKEEIAETVAALSPEQCADIAATLPATTLAKLGLNN